MFNIFHLSFLKKSAYFEIEKRYPYPALHKVYKQYRNRIIDNLVSSGEPVNLVHGCFKSHIVAIKRFFIFVRRF